MGTQVGGVDLGEAAREAAAREAAERDAATRDAAAEVSYCKYGQVRGLVAVVVRHC